MDIRIAPRRLVLSLFIVQGILLLLHIAAYLPVLCLDRSNPVALFDFNVEANFPTAFSTALLWLCALLTIAVAGAGGGRLRRIQWMGLSAAFAFMGVDEYITLHERLIEPLRRCLELSGPLHFAWVLPYMGLVLLFILLYWRFYRELPPETRRWICIATGLYVAGSIGFEMIGGAWVEHAGLDVEWFVMDNAYMFLTTVEESLEMAGSIVFIYAFADYIDKRLPDLRLRIASK